MKYLQSELRGWPMLAVDYENVRDPIIYPVLVQEKLNGVRAKWDGEKQLFISRQGEVWPEHVIPHLYEEFRGLPELLDGELYSPDLSFQEITQAVSINRLAIHPNAEKIQYCVFDVIDCRPAEERLKDSLCLLALRCDNLEEVFRELNTVTQHGGEGLIIRQCGCPYIPGRTEALIKLKPWRMIEARIVDFIEGLGKFSGMLGALVVEWNNKQFKVGGGPGLNDYWRRKIWVTKEKWHGKIIDVRYRELSDTGIPLQGQTLFL